MSICGSICKRIYLTKLVFFTFWIFFDVSILFTLVFANKISDSSIYLVLMYPEATDSLFVYRSHTSTSEHPSLHKGVLKVLY